jgi:hypothetical protein
VREGTNAEGVEAGGGEHEAEIHEEGLVPVEYKGRGPEGDNAEVSVDVRTSGIRLTP